MSCTRWDQVTYYPWGKKGTWSPKDVNFIQQGFYYGFTEPASLAGQKLVQTYYFKSDTESFYYFTGQRRVRRLPAYAYDTPHHRLREPVPATIRLVHVLRQSGPLRLEDRRQEGNLHPLRRTRTRQPAPPDQGVTQPYIPNDMRRYELHRVWVVEGNLKAGMRHSDAQEGSLPGRGHLARCAAEEYDASGKLWRHKEAGVMPAWELDACVNASLVMFYDFSNGRYVLDSNVVGGAKDIRFMADEKGDPHFNSNYYTPENLRAISER